MCQSASFSNTGGEPGGELQRIRHASVRVEIPVPPAAFFDAFAGWVKYENWAPEWQTAAHWLAEKKGGVGSRFCLYDKPNGRHLVQFGEVVEFEPGRRFAWRAPFGEWPRAWIGSILEVEPTGDGGTIATETFYFDAREEHLPVLNGFLTLPGLDAQSITNFLQARITGLGQLIRTGEIGPDDLTELFPEDRAVAQDWQGRLSPGKWVRVLYADGGMEFDGPPDVVFNAFSRFARYADWTREIHVGKEWLNIVAGGIGSRFLLWEKPGDRHVLHYGVVTECERNRKFAWRASFAEWGKVMLGTAMTITGSTASSTTAYHVLYVDLPEEYLPILMGFGTLRGFDLEFETFHIYEEAKGFNELLRSGSFSDDDTSYLFDADCQLARDIPLQNGEEWPELALSLKPERVMTFEEMLAEVSGIMTKIMPSPEFLTKYRDLERTWKYNSREVR